MPLLTIDHFPYSHNSVLNPMFPTFLLSMNPAKSHLGIGPTEYIVQVNSFLTPTSTSRINLLSNKQPKSSNRGIFSVFKGATLVFEAKKHNGRHPDKQAAGRQRPSKPLGSYHKNREALYDYRMKNRLKTQTDCRTSAKCFNFSTNFFQTNAIFSGIIHPSPIYLCSDWSNET